MGAWVEVDLDAVLRNARRLAARVSVPLIPMIKADGYGLGAVAVAQVLDAVDPWGFGIATVDEGAALRAAGVRRPILVFTPLLVDEMEGAARADLTPALGSVEAIQAWSQYGRAWQLAIDTGLHRNGVMWDAIDTLREAVVARPPEGAFTHFHSADTDPHATATQLGRFRAAVAKLPARPRYLHTENSPALERLDGPSEWDLVRPGVYLYGVGATADPVASLRGSVVEVRTVMTGESVSYGATYRADSPRRVATLGLGYADGYPRAFSNVGRAMLNGYETRVIGAVTMDMTMIDVTNVPCAVGDTATLLGRSGDRVLDAVAVARDAGMSPYELLTGLRGRASRVYTGSYANLRGHLAHLAV